MVFPMEKKTTISRHFASPEATYEKPGNLFTLSDLLQQKNATSLAKVCNCCRCYAHMFFLHWVDLSVTIDRDNKVAFDMKDIFQNRDFLRIF